MHFNILCKSACICVCLCVCMCRESCKIIVFYGLLLHKFMNAKGHALHEQLAACSLQPYCSALYGQIMDWELMQNNREQSKSSNQMQLPQFRSQISLQYARSRRSENFRQYCFGHGIEYNTLYHLNARLQCIAHCCWFGLAKGNKLTPTLLFRAMK